MPVYVDYVFAGPYAGSTSTMSLPAPMLAYFGYVTKDPYGGLEVGSRPQLRRPSLHHSGTARQMRSRRQSRPDNELVFGVCGISCARLLFRTHVFAVVQPVQLTLAMSLESMQTRCLHSGSFTWTCLQHHADCCHFGRRWRGLIIAQFLETSPAAPRVRAHVTLSSGTQPYCWWIH